MDKGESQIRNSTIREETHYVLKLLDAERSDNLVQKAGIRFWMKCDEVSQRKMITLQTTNKALQARVEMARKALETLKVAVNDKQPDPGASLFISKVLAHLTAPPEGKL